ncbi:unnamed protein product [Brassicogethes aeneus]|uniref:Uncharacterized protein n=1 Tax=Brassicogethes aeneus TaxID=1431903 RepID=A0A9P0FJS2_BRAAE|nr:unnamed protein product [Brassicogethes aeneus]
MEGVSTQDAIRPDEDGALINNNKENRKKMNKELIISILNRVGLVFLGYVVAYMSWSLILPLITIGTLVWLENKTNKTKESIKKKATASNLSKDDLLKLLNNELPSWVTFPDRERAEWLNEIVLNLWPNISKHIIKLCRTKIQNNIRKKFDSFKFEDIDFGETPPKIDGIKMYSKRKDSIIVDFDVFYDGNCDINFSIMGNQIGRIKDFQLEVQIRVILKPLLVKMPLVGGIQVFFLNTPDISFEIEGISKLPGLNYFLRQKIEHKIRKTIVFPNSFTKRFTKTIEASELKALEPEGILRVHVFEAKNLEKKDVTGKSDPYVILSVGAQEYTTHVIKKSLDPKWDYWCEFVILDPLAQQLYFKVFDEDDFNEDDFLGSGAVEIHSVIKQGENDRWFKLEKAKHGDVHLRFTWLGLSPEYHDLHAAIADTQQLQVSHLATALLTFYVDSARTLPMKGFKKPDPYFKVSLGTQQIFKSKSKKHTNDPEWEQGSSVLVQDPHNDIFTIHIFDKRTEQKICYFEYPLRNLTTLNFMQISKEVFPLVTDEPDSYDSQIIISLQLRVLSNALYEGDSDSDSDFEDLGKHISKSSSLKRNSLLTSPDSDKSHQLINEERTQVRKSSRLSSTPSNGDGKLSFKSKNSSLSRSGSGFGQLELTIDYSKPRQKLMVIIHQIKGLSLKQTSDEPDPYVKIKLFSPGVTTKKHKTRTISDTPNPEFEEFFEYLLATNELTTSKLVLTVKSKKYIFNSNILGQVVIKFEKIIEKLPFRFWVDLGPQEESD